jgi:transcriptional regulator with XRE-family HTH domain
MMTEESIGDRIRRVRTEHDVSQAGLARRAGMNAASLNRIERGKVKPQDRTVIDLARALGVPVEELTGEK